MAPVTAPMNFLVRDSLYDDERPYLLIYEPPAGFPKQNIKLEKHTDLRIEDIRVCKDQPSLDKNGFQITKFSSKMSRADFDNEELVKTVYLKEVVDHVQAIFGAQKVQIFEYVLRKRHEQFPISTGEPYEFNQPTSIAHVDTTHSWTEEMVKRLNPATANQLLESRVLCVNVWKPLRGPVRDWPLALCDPLTVDTQDLHPGDLVYDDYVVENMQLHYDDNQNWYYISLVYLTQLFHFQKTKILKCHEKA
ncbi:uncharacterized protein LY89DRAFT_733488 [Mollisia scopiformis]|uniref:Uncharacterized protein n=1 Tax=Mollisia scopiformis TaxID=149040 RepID=A0A194XBV4_MOLSC|nr:uncharacterized protein LY89DRAFT_733488 [Mollisia scopiformis]KUJ17653.1 hypothetical protein LY89DRAFT_733488 [Mollisia scopiformis]